ncbi:MAG: alanine racemase [Acidobacteria bacterium]|nr:alanine racemase [Acidobacteriota bacterium]
MSAPVQARSWVEVDLHRIATNYRAIATALRQNPAAAAGIEIMPVVKSDAYGHGMVPVARTLAAEGARWFGVSSFEEGLELRASDVAQRILVMADHGFDAQRHSGLTPVIHSLDEIPTAPYHLKVDTGMHRLGVLANAQEIAARVRGTTLEGLMTHFASSSDFTSPQTRDQQRRFDAVLAALDQPPPYLHSSSTNPLHFGLSSAWGNLVRPGLALYGYVSAPKGSAPSHLLDVRPALTWKARVIAVKEVPAGAKIGYGGMFVAPKPMRIAIVGAGYADGLSRRLSNKNRFVGAISMDVSTIDISDSPGIRPGDAITLLDEHYDARAMARDAGVIAYSVLTGISARVQHVYR